MVKENIGDLKKASEVFNMDMGVANKIFDDNISSSKIISTKI